MSYNNIDNQGIAEVSVIMPVYNGQVYIERGIKAVLNQSLYNIELIVVDDGSTDNTAAICNQLACEDKRVIVLHEQHRGVTHARQIGLNHVGGKYVIHLDSDDFYDSTMLENLVLCAEKNNSDMVICDWEVQDEQSKVYQSQEPTELNCEAIANDIICGKTHGSLCNKLIKTSIIRENDIAFRSQLTMREDLFFVLDVLLHINKISYLPKSLYTYNRMQNTRSLTQRYIADVQNFYLQEILFHSWILRYPLISDNLLKYMRERLMSDAYITLVRNVFDEKKWCDLLRPYREDLSNTSNSKYNKLLVLVALDHSYVIAQKWSKMFEKMRFRKMQILRLLRHT